MANAAGIIEDSGAQSPSQAALDAMVADFEFLPPTELIEEKIKALKKYIKDMEDAVEKGAEDAYNDALERFNEKKQELLDWLNNAKSEIDAKIHEITDPIVESFKAQIPDPIKKVCDVDVVAPSISPKLPAADPGAIVSFLEDLVLAIVFPYKPIIKTIQFWITHFIPKLTSYIATRTTSLTKMIADVTAIVPPAFQST